MDWAIVVLVLAFAVRGAIRGSVSQLFSILGLLAGVWTAGWVAQWVGEHWRGARPAAVFWLLRWLAAFLLGFSVMALAQWWGDRLGDSARRGLLGTVDRMLGAAVGLAFGGIVTAFVLLAALRIVPAREVDREIGHARLARGILGGAVELASASAGWLPGHGWLGRQFLIAERRLRDGGEAHRAVSDS